MQIDGVGLLHNCEDIKDSKDLVGFLKDSVGVFGRGGYVLRGKEKT